MKHFFMLIFIVILSLPNYAQKRNIEDIEFTAKLYCYLERNRIITGIDSILIDTSMTFHFVKDFYGFDSSNVMFIKINTTSGFFKDEYYLAYIKGVDLLLRFQGFHENDFRRFMWFYEYLSNPIRDNPYRNSNRFANKHYVKGIDLYHLHKEWKRIKKSKFKFNSSNEEKQWSII